MPNHSLVIPPSERVMGWLRGGVPLTLLADLADPDGPPSREILRREAVADDVRRELSRLDAAGRGSPARPERWEGTDDFAPDSAAC